MDIYSFDTVKALILNQSDMLQEINKLKSENQSLVRDMRLKSSTIEELREENDKMKAQVQLII